MVAVIVPVEQIAWAQGDVHLKSADNDTLKNGYAHLNTFKCHGIIWHTSVVPNFAIPNFAVPNFPSGSKQALVKESDTD